MSGFTQGPQVQPAHELNKYFLRGKISCSELHEAFLLGDISSNDAGAADKWLAGLNDRRQASSSQLAPNPQETHPGLIAVA